MFISPQELLTLLEHYKYWLVFPIAVFEGPIISIISGFLVFGGQFNAYIIYPLLVLADLVGDSLYYYIGKRGGRSGLVKRIGRYLGYREESEKYIEEHFVKHPGKTLLLAKFSHGVGSTVQVTAGIAKMNYFRFIEWNFLGQIVKSFVLLAIGYYAGQYYEKINGYLETISLVTFTLFVIAMLYFVVSRRAKAKLLQKED